MPYKIPGSLRGMPNIDDILLHYEYIKDCEDEYIDLLQVKADFYSKYKAEFEIFKTAYKGEKPRNQNVNKTHLWRALTKRYQNKSYSAAVKDYFYLMCVKEQFSIVDQKYRQQPQGNRSGNPNLSQTLTMNPTPASLGTPKFANTIHVPGRQQSVDSVLDHGHHGRQDLEQEMSQLRQLAHNQGEEIKALQKLKSENIVIIEDLRSRLSGFASKQLTEGNPNFTDLSDKNRPMKIADRFHSLYDEEWTNSLEVLTAQKSGMLSDESAITLLMNITKGIYKFCQDIIQQQTQSIILNILKPCTPNVVKEKYNEVNIDIAKRLEKQILAMRRETCMEPVSNLTEKFKEISRDYASYQKYPEVVKYVEKSVEIVWLMATSDPSMTLVWPEYGEKFNTNMFNHYTKKGDKVSLAVWPAVLLHQGGPVIHKGYAKPL